PRGGLLIHDDNRPAMTAVRQPERLAGADNRDDTEAVDFGATNGASVHLPGEHGIAASWAGVGVGETGAGEDVAGAGLDVLAADLGRGARLDGITRDAQQ